MYNLFASLHPSDVKCYEGEPDFLVKMIACLSPKSLAALFECVSSLRDEHYKREKRVKEFRKEVEESRGARGFDIENDFDEKIKGSASWLSFYEKSYDNPQFWQKAWEERIGVFYHKVKSGVVLSLLKREDFDENESQNRDSGDDDEEEEEGEEEGSEEDNGSDDSEDESGENSSYDDRNDGEEEESDASEDQNYSDNERVNGETVGGVPRERKGRNLAALRCSESPSSSVDEKIRDRSGPGGENSSDRSKVDGVYYSLREKTKLEDKLRKRRRVREEASARVARKNEKQRRDAGPLPGRLSENVDADSDDEERDSETKILTNSCLTREEYFYRSIELSLSDGSVTRAVSDVGFSILNDPRILEKLLERKRLPLMNTWCCAGVLSCGSTECGHGDKNPEIAISSMKPINVSPLRETRIRGVYANENDEVDFENYEGLDNANREERNAGRRAQNGGGGGGNREIVNPREEPREEERDEEGEDGTSTYEMQGALFSYEKFYKKNKKIERRTLHDLNGIIVPVLSAELPHKMRLKVSAFVRSVCNFCEYRSKKGLLAFFRKCVVSGNETFREGFPLSNADERNPGGDSGNTPFRLRKGKNGTETYEYCIYDAKNNVLFFDFASYFKYNCYSFGGAFSPDFSSASATFEDSQSFHAASFFSNGPKEIINACFSILSVLNLDVFEYLVVKCLGELELAVRLPSNYRNRTTTARTQEGNSFGKDTYERVEKTMWAGTFDCASNRADRYSLESLCTCIKTSNDISIKDKERHAELLWLKESRLKGESSFENALSLMLKNAATKFQPKETKRFEISSEASILQFFTKRRLVFELYAKLKKYAWMEGSEREELSTSSSPRTRKMEERLRKIDDFIEGCKEVKTISVTIERGLFLRSYAPLLEEDDWSPFSLDAEGTGSSNGEDGDSGKEIYCAFSENERRKRLRVGGAKGYVNAGGRRTMTINGSHIQKERAFFNDEDGYYADNIPTEEEEEEEEGEVDGEEEEQRRKNALNADEDEEDKEFAMEAALLKSKKSLKRSRPREKPVVVRMTNVHRDCPLFAVPYVLKSSYQ